MSRDGLNPVTCDSMPPDPELCAPCTRDGVHGFSALHRGKTCKNFWCPPPTLAPDARVRRRTTTTWRCRHERGVACSRSPVEAESELRRAGDDLKVVEWIEFKPRRGTRSTKLNRSNWSSDDLKEKRNVADRTVAVALVGVRRSEDAEMASHRKGEKMRCLQVA